MSSPPTELVHRLEAAKDRPLDDTPRLVLADWLEEHGQADRAEFIRVQCRLASLHTVHPENGLIEIAKLIDIAPHGWGLEWHALRQRERELLDRHKDEWLGPLPEIALAWSFRRGLIILENVFTEELTTRATEADGWEEIWPWVECLRLNLPFASQLFGHPLCRRFTGIDFSVVVGSSKAALRALFASPHMAHLRHLNFKEHPLKDEGAIGLASWSGARNLISLGLSLCKVGPEGAKALANSDHLSNLAILDLGSNYDLKQAGAEALAGWAHPGKLTHLELFDDAIGPAGAAALAASRTLTGLVHLGLAQNNVKDAGATALAAAAHLATLRRLILRSNGLTAAGIESLARSPHLMDLAMLDLGYCNMTVRGARALAHTPGLKQLTALLVEGADLGDAGVQELAAGPAASRLTDLNLRANGIGPKGIAALGQSSHFQALNRLDLGKNELGDEGVRILAQSPLFPQLNWLSLECTGIGADGVKALVKKPNHLQYLLLQENTIGADGAKALASAPLKELTELDVNDCYLREEGYRALARGKGLRALRRLFLDLSDTEGRERDFATFRVRFK